MVFAQFMDLVDFRNGDKGSHLQNWEEKKLGKQIDMPMCVYLHINIFIYLILKYFDGYNLRILYKYLYHLLRYFYPFTCC